MEAKKRTGYGVAMWDREKYPLLVTFTDAFFIDGYSCDTIEKNRKAKWPAYRMIDEDLELGNYTVLIKQNGYTWEAGPEHIVLAQRDKPTIVIMSRAVA